MEGEGSIIPMSESTSRHADDKSPAKVRLDPAICDNNSDILLASLNQVFGDILERLNLKDPQFN